MTNLALRYLPPIVAQHTLDHRSDIQYIASPTIQHSITTAWQSQSAPNAVHACKPSRILIHLDGASAIASLAPFSSELLSTPFLAVANEA